LAFDYVPALASLVPH